MSRYFIESVKYGFGEGGMACGPVEGEFAFSIQYKKDDEPSKWITVVDMLGTDSTYMSDEDILDKLLSMNADNDEEIAEIDELYIEEFEGIKLGEAYDDDVFEQIYGKQKDNPVVPLIKYIATFIEASEEECDDLVAMATGKYIDEVEIIAKGVELGYLEGLGLNDDNN